MFVLFGSDERDGLNTEATAVINRLYNAGDGVVKQQAQPTYGPVIIFNEDDDEAVGFDMSDYPYLMNKLYSDVFFSAGVDALPRSKDSTIHRCS